MDKIGIVWTLKKKIRNTNLQKNHVFLEKVGRIWKHKADSSIVSVNVDFAHAHGVTKHSKVL